MPAMKPLLRIGTRRSPLALAQAREVRARLADAHPALAAPDAIEIVPLQTTGDSVRDRPLADIGGKGLFTKEIEEALIEGSVDVAVHSMKDVATWLPPGLVIDCVLPRENPLDAFFARDGATLDTLAPGSRVGTSALRRQALILARRPDVTVVPLRGNVATRLRKLEDGAVDATLLAVAGLNRLGKTDIIDQVLDPAVMLPAVAQGAIAVERRIDDPTVAAWLAAIDCRRSRQRVTAERALLKILDGSCRTPIAALATVDDDGGLRLDGLVALPDGSRVHRVSERGAAVDAVAIGEAAGHALADLAGPDFLAALSAPAV